MGRWWAGIDWSQKHGHEVAVVDQTGELVVRDHIEETPDGVRHLLRLLSGLSRSNAHSRKRVPIAIETSRGLLIAELRRRGQPVIALNPAMVARYRGRTTPTRRRKSDAEDAQMLAHIIRVDGELLRSLSSPSPHIEALRELVREQWRARRAQRYADNRLRGHLAAYYPAALAAWDHLPGKLTRAEARALLELAPTPARAAGLSRIRIAQTIAAAGRTRLVADTAARLHTEFQQRRLRQPPETEQAMGRVTLLLLDRLNQAIAHDDALTLEIDTLFSTHPLAPIYLSFPGVGPTIGARLLAEIGDDPQRFTDARGLRAYAGAAPLTWASGGTHTVTARTICNKWLKATGHHWAFSALNRSPGARAYYDRRKTAGDRNAAALRRLFGRLLSCLHHCVITGQPYREHLAFPHSSETDPPPESGDHPVAAAGP